MNKTGKIRLEKIAKENRKSRDRGAYWAFRNAVKAYNKYIKFRNIVN